MKTMSLSTIKQFSLQEVFDHVAKHLLTQGKPALDSEAGFYGPQCVYRAKDGSSCAVGCVMTDTEYDQKYEKQGILSMEFDKFFSPVNREQYLSAADIEAEADDHRRLLSELQQVHDGGIYPANGLLIPYWKDELRLVANGWDLGTSVLEGER